MKNSNTFIDNEIDLLDIILNLWKSRNLIIKVTLSFSIIGILYSFNLNNIYKANSIFYPHIEKIDNSQNLKSLAGLAGINIDSEISDNIPSNLYPNLINSPIFKIELLNSKIKIDNNSITYRDYLQNKLENSFSFLIFLKKQFSQGKY